MDLRPNWKVVLKRKIYRAWIKSVLAEEEDTDFRIVKELKSDRIWRVIEQWEWSDSPASDLGHSTSRKIGLQEEEAVGVIIMAVWVQDAWGTSEMCNRQLETQARSLRERPEYNKKILSIISMVLFKPIKEDKHSDIEQSSRKDATMKGMRRKRNPEEERHHRTEGESVRRPQCVAPLLPVPKSYVPCKSM